MNLKVGLRFESLGFLLWMLNSFYSEYKHLGARVVKTPTTMVQFKAHCTGMENRRKESRNSSWGPIKMIQSRFTAGPEVM